MTRFIELLPFVDFFKLTVDWAAFASWQSFLFLGTAIAAGHFLRRSPWKYHFSLVLGAAASVFVPTISLLLLRIQGGILPVGSLFAMEKQAFGPASLLGPTIVLGGLAFAVLILCNIITARRFMFQAKPFPDRDSQEALLEGAKVMRNVSLPILFTSNAVKTPTVWSWGLHPAVLLPESLSETLSKEERDAIFLHELAHIARRDHWAALFVRLCGVVLFWNPLYWLLLRLCDLAADQSCDLLVLSQEKLSTDVYGETLLRLAAGSKHPPIFQSLSRKEQLMKRLNLILDYADHPERYSVTPPKSLVATALVLLLLSGAFALCQERKDDSATPDTRTSYEKTADGLIARFAKNDFSDEKFTDTMKQQKVSETCEMLWKDFGKQFGSFLDWKTVKTESVLQFQRVHQRCEFEKGYVTYMIVVDKSDNIAGMFVISVDKKEEKEKGNDDIKSYPVNKSVTEFPSEVEDLSTPEAAYVAFNRATCLQDPAKIKEAMIRLSIPAYRSGFEQETFSLAEPEWAKVLANAEILEVNQYRDEMATVVAKLQDDNVRKPFDVRNLEKIDGKWLNAGNDRCDSLEKARGVFRVVFLERMERKDLLNSALAKEVVSREVEKNVSEFPEKEDLSSPEAAYANFNRAMRLQDGTELKTAMVRLSVPRLSEVIARENPTPGPADWNEILKNAKIKTTFVFRDSKAIVIAFLPGDQVRKPFDVRLFEKIDGKWLNKGNDRFNSLEDARMEFLRRVNNEYGNTPLPTFDETEATVKTP